MNKKAPTGIGAFFVHFNILNTFTTIILSYIFYKINVIIANEKTILNTIDSFNIFIAI